MSYCPDYSSDLAYFIARGKTLVIIQKYEDDCKNAEAIANKLAADLGAESYIHYLGFSFDHAKKPNARKTGLIKRSDSSDGNIYVPDIKTVAGRRLAETVNDIPFSPLTYSHFARRLTGQKNIKTNPDNLYSVGRTLLQGEGETTAALFEKIG